MVRLHLGSQSRYGQTVNRCLYPRGQVLKVPVIAKGEFILTNTKHVQRTQQGQQKFRQAVGNEIQEFILESRSHGEVTLRSSDQQKQGLAFFSQSLDFSGEKFQFLDEEFIRGRQDLGLGRNGEQSNLPQAGTQIQ